MKKTLCLKDAMRSLHVIETDEGIELQSAAGTAKYDAWGARREVNGIPEYFPSSVTVNKRPQALVDDKGPSVPDDSCAPLVRTMKLRVELDTSGAQQAVDELDDKIRKSDAAFKALNDIYQLPRMKISADQQVMNTIADALDEVCRRYFEVFGHPESGKTNAVSLDGRWVAVEGNFTHEEVRDAVEHIKRLRKQKADEKAMAESSPFAMKDGQVFIKNAVIQKVQLSRTETDPRKGYAIRVGIGPEIKTSIKLSPEMEKAISDVVSAELKKNLQPGGTIWNSLKSGF